VVFDLFFCFVCFVFLYWFEGNLLSKISQKKGRGGVGDQDRRRARGGKGFDVNPSFGRRKGRVTGQRGGRREKAGDGVRIVK